MCLYNIFTIYCQSPALILYENIIKIVNQKILDGMSSTRLLVKLIFFSLLNMNVEFYHGNNEK